MVDLLLDDGRNVSEEASNVVAADLVEHLHHLEVGHHSAVVAFRKVLLEAGLQHGGQLAKAALVVDGQHGLDDATNVFKGLQ